MIIVNARFLTQPISGVQRFSIEICKNLRFNNYELQFVSPKNIIHKELAEQLNVYTDLPCSNLKGHLWEQISLPLYLKKIKKDYLLVCLGNSGPLIIKKQIYVLHDIGFKINPNWYSFRFSLYYKIIVPILLKRCKHIITVSNTSKDLITRYYNIKPSKISVVYNGFCLPIIIDNVPQIKINKNYILSVSSFNPRKNLSKLIKAFLKMNDPNMHLYLVGNFSNNYKKSELLKNDKVHLLTGVQDYELAYLYKNASLFVYPSLYEGFGIPILEAMHFNLKICASNIDCFKELFSNSISYFNQNSVNDISQVMKFKLRENKNVDYKEFTDKYSWSESARKLEKIIIKLH